MLSTLLNQKSGYSDTDMSRFCLLVLFERSELNLFYPIFGKVSNFGNCL